jgi:deazaflavin-dependent oxidoreductase (nitroreductase family)
VLTTTGRRSGNGRRNALIYGIDGDDYLVASKGGNKNHPHWYLNLVADPNVHVQVGAEEIQRYGPSRVTGTETASLAHDGEDLAEYDRYQARTKRDIPVAILERS